MREQENFGQARSGTFGGEFSFANERPIRITPDFVFERVSRSGLSYTESIGPRRRLPPDYLGVVRAGHVEADSTLTFDAGLRMYKWAHPYNGGGGGIGVQLRAFRSSVGRQASGAVRAVRVGNARRALNPVTGEILPDTFIGLIVPGTGDHAA